MLDIRGKYNSAKVFTDVIEQEAIAQIMLLLNQEFTKDSKVRMMPDVHAGTGCTVGTTMTITDKVVPNLVGVDIGCGMLTIKLNDTNIDFAKLDAVIRKYVPSGCNIHEKPLVKQAKNSLSNLRCYSQIDEKRAIHSLGSLGGGNHFIEIDKDKDNNHYLIIHTGSRHLGLEVAKYYQRIAYDTCNHAGKDDVANLIESYKKQGRQREIEQAIITLKNTKRTNIPKDLCYLTGSEMNDYLHDIIIIQDFATENRELIAKQIIEYMNFDVAETFCTIHNYIDVDSMILRKGSISAKLGEKVLIPMNMRDGSLICIGKGNDDWNQSAPHGAGRLMSRGAAKANINLDDYKESMKDIWTTSVNEATIDESPMVYKPMESIIENIIDTVDIVDIIKPVYNFKASDM